jgi:hypothetical protein
MSMGWLAGTKVGRATTIAVNEDPRMSDNDKPTETETILMALDQVSQTIDVMTSVVNRLRNYVQQQEVTATDKSQEMAAEIQPDRILH